MKIVNYPRILLLLYIQLFVVNKRCRIELEQILDRKVAWVNPRGGEGVNRYISYGCEGLLGV